MCSDQPSGVRCDLDEDRLRAILEEHPLRLAVLFGSTVHGDRHPGSDVDLVVELDSADADTLDARLSLLADLSAGLDRNDVDLAVVDDLDPRVGERAFGEGRLLVGTEERFDDHRRRFDRLADGENHASLAERFDAAIDRLEQVVDG